MEVKKDHIILVAAVVLPFGLVALGLWKAFELFKKSKEEKTKKD